MIRKILLITALAIFPLFTFSCSDSGSNGEKTSITVDFNGAEVYKSLAGVSEIQKAPGTSVLPTDIETITIQVTDGNDIIFSEDFDRDVIANSSDTLALDIPTGKGLVFTVFAYDASGSTVRYSFTSAPIDLVPGVETTISIVLVPEVILQDANFSIKLVKPDGSTAYKGSEPVYLRTINPIVVEVFKPQYVDEEFSLGTPLAAGIDKTDISNIQVTNVFVKTYQLVIVKAYGEDNTIAAIGSYIISNLSSGDNGIINVRMVPPGRLNIVNNAPIASYSVDMEYPSGWQTVDPGSGSTIIGNTVLVLVPNNRIDIGKETDPETLTVARNIRITVNTVPKFDETVDNTKSIGWKIFNVDFFNWIWTEQ